MTANESTLNGVDHSSPINISPSARNPLLDSTSSLSRSVTSSQLELEPTHNGVSNTDVDWLSRGSSLKDRGQYPLPNSVAGGRVRTRSNSLPPVPSGERLPPQLGRSKATTGVSVEGGQASSKELGGSDQSGENIINNKKKIPAAAAAASTIEEDEEAEESSEKGPPLSPTSTTLRNPAPGPGYANQAVTAHSKLSQGLRSSKTMPIALEKTQVGSELTRSISVSSAALGKSPSDKLPSTSPSNARRGSWFHNLSSKFSSSSSHNNNGSSVVSNQRRASTSGLKNTVPGSTLSTGSVKDSPSSGLGLDVESHSNLAHAHVAGGNIPPSANPIFSPSYTNNRNLPTNRILDTHPPRTSSPKLSPEIAVGGTAQSPSPSSAFPFKQEHNRSNSVSSTGSLVNRLRRLSTRSNGSQSDLISTQFKAESQQVRVILNKNHSKKPCKIPELEGVLPPTVRFKAEVFETDPPQQIPARNPRTGNITFGPNGEINREPLPPNGYPMPLYVLPRNYGASTLAASQSAYESAIRVANSVKSSGGVSIFKSRNSLSSTTSFSSNNTEYDEEKDVSESDRTQSLKIDKPMHSAERMGSGSTNTTTASTGDSSVEDDDLDEQGKELTLETIYTRCCHLREILPIAATLKQIKDRKPPLEVIKMMNPRPTLIEILSLSDFLSVVPVRMLIFDNVSLSTEMFRIILSSVVTSDHLERLSLRNLILDDKGWKLFCAFFSENSSLVKLDLSIEKVNSKQPSDRSLLDWDLFTKALVARGGVEELILNGCVVPSDELAPLIFNGCSLSTKRLGLALNDLLPEDLQVIMKWAADPSCVCEGLDLGGNLMDQSWDAIKEILKGKCLKFLSLNSTGLANVTKANEIFGGVCSHSNLIMLDLSSNPDLFPKFTHVLAKVLPTFTDLRRIHLESNNLSPEDVMLLADAFARCPKLVHISVLDNRRLDSTACAALAIATHISNTIYRVESDNDLWPVILQRRLAHNCLVNMELTAGRITQQEKDSDDDGLFGKEDLMNTGNYIAMAAEELLKSIKEDDDNDSEDAQGHLVVSEMVRRAKQVRVKIRKTLDELFEKRRSGVGLVVEEKERLVRLCFLDGTLEKVLDKYNQTKLYKHENQNEESTKGSGNDVSTQNRMGTTSLSGKSVPPLNMPPLLPVDREVVLSTTVSTHPDFTIAPVSEYPEVQSLSRRSSVTSLHRKEQELEEGELHRFGTFIRSHRDSHTDLSDDDEDEDAHVVDSEEDIRRRSSDEGTGEELRQKILAAKGSQSVSELIQQLQQMHGPELDRILAAGKDKSLSERDDILLRLNHAARPRSAQASTPPEDTKLLAGDYVTLDSVVDDIARALT
ncbi:protein phosphatase regulator GIP3 [Sugiyamaella lignohabitans]|uniref:Protein phosphatase regulator GIP3 n=1 Tax=Sugiyamaella lignohabitans TaxID=796027 RepID=A0A167C2Z4_9ASCO|nr:protein phosphatase regulator GIP3 [Sugiyamaella lignohabitans]ANB11155.1 protein phosphatase regulator GIP3 [Sugiyamaella lignohabitans]